MTIDLPEVDLIRRIKSGDEKAFELVFKTYYSVLSIYAKKFVHDIETGKEIVQDLFVKLYENRATLQINSTLKGYLFKSVHNKCLTYLTQNQLHNKHKEQIALIEKEREIDETDFLEQTQLEEKIFKSINSLPDQCQRIFRMSRFDGRKNKEIADELGISIRTVETQISKALKILRENLEGILLIISWLVLFLNKF